MTGPLNSAQLHSFMTGLALFLGTDSPEMREIIVERTIEQISDLEDCGSSDPDSPADDCSDDTP